MKKKFSYKYLKKKNLKHITIKKSLPFNSSTRHYKYITKYLLSKQNRILKASIFNIKRAYGKCSYSGKTLLWGRNSGCKKLYRKLCFFNQDTLGIILFSIYDPNRTCFISAFFDLQSYKFSYIPSLIETYAGTIAGCQSSKKKYYALGFRYRLNMLQLGLNISFISKNVKNQALYSKAAGTFCQLLNKTMTSCKIRLPSGLILLLPSTCFATLGKTSNKFNRLIIIGKAGRNRLKGIKPTVRGIAMNPVDNPHGGRTNGGCCWVTPWGKPFLFKKTSRANVKNKL